MRLYNSHNSHNTKEETMYSQRGQDMPCLCGSTPPGNQSPSEHQRRDQHTHSVHYNDPTREKKAITSQRQRAYHIQFDINSHYIHISYSMTVLTTYCNRVLHIGYAAVELGEVELWAVGEGEGEVPTCPTCIKCCLLAILTVAHYTSMVPAYRDTLYTVGDMGYGSDRCQLIKK